ncbi:MAG: ABC transporter ATP-binding protein [Holophaga sp.]|jgi:branched-chain amino acid transport system ATP-binding protein
MLKLERIDSGYDYLQVLWDVSFHVDEGEFVALIGPNGAGKTTTLRTIAGTLRPRSGAVTFKGRDMVGTPAYKVSRAGISYVSEQLNLFTNMTVRENLLMGAYHVHDKRKQQEKLEYTYRIFPRLKEREGQLAGTMSGGERKMLAIGRGVMADPQLMLVDEPSLGLAPNTTAGVFQALLELRKSGVTILLVEQNVHLTLDVTDRAYVIENGRIVMGGASSELKHNPHVQNAYLGI